MSAWLCSRRHVATLARYAIYYRVCGAQEKTPQEVAAVLWSANVRSLVARYGDNIEEKQLLGCEPKDWTAMEILNAPQIEPVVLLKQCKCFDYQSCEANEWKYGDPAYNIVHSVEGEAIHHLPGYDEAPWGLDD
jgi:hypothetical protein